MEFLGSLKTSAPVVDGVATAELTFPITGEHEVTASFRPKIPAIQASHRHHGDGRRSGRRPERRVRECPGAFARGVKATVAQGAEGTVRFRLGDATVTAKVDSGVATAELPTGPNPGQQEITAEFTPAPRSAFAAGTARAPITIDAVTGTTIELSADQAGPIRPGQPVSISATVTPAENTERAEGTVEFLIDGERITRTLENHATSVEFTPDRAGDFPVEAKFIPADDTQTPAEDALTLQVKGAPDPPLEVDAPPSVAPLVEAPTTVTVTPAAAGTVTAVIDGRRIPRRSRRTRAPPPVAGVPTRRFEVPITFVPANPADAKRRDRRRSPCPGNKRRRVALCGPAAERQASYTTTLTPGRQPAQRDGFPGNSHRRQAGHKGETARIRLSVAGSTCCGTAPVRKAAAVFHNASGEEFPRAAAAVTVAGDTGTPGDGNNQNPGDGNNNQVTPGGSSSSATNPFAPLIDFFRMLWEWLTSLFSGGGSSSGSSSASRD